MGVVSGDRAQDEAVHPFASQKLQVVQLTSRVLFCVAQDDPVSPGLGYLFYPAGDLGEKRVW